MLALLLGAVALCGSAIQTRFVGFGRAYRQSGCNPPDRTLSGATECFAYAAVDLNFVAFNDSPGAIMMQPAQSWRLGLANNQMHLGMGPRGAWGGYGSPTQYTETAWVSLVSTRR